MRWSKLDVGVIHATEYFGWVIFPAVDRVGKALFLVVYTSSPLHAHVGSVLRWRSPRFRYFLDGRTG